MPASSYLVIQTAADKPLLSQTAPPTVIGMHSVPASPQPVGMAGQTGRGASVVSIYYIFLFFLSVIRLALENSRLYAHLNACFLTLTALLLLHVFQSATRAFYFCCCRTTVRYDEKFLFFSLYASGSEPRPLSYATHFCLAIGLK